MMVAVPEFLLRNGNPRCKRVAEGAVEGGRVRQDPTRSDPPSGGVRPEEGKDWDVKWKEGGIPPEELGNYTMTFVSENGLTRTQM